MAASIHEPRLAKSIAGLVFVVFWVIAIVAWVLVGSLSGHALRGFVADIGIVFAAVGFAAPFVETMSNFVRSLWLGLAAIALFALGGFLDYTIVVYTLRLLVPTFALLAPVNRFSNNFRVWQ